MKTTALATVLLISATMACTRKPNAQEQCQQNMQRLWEASRSHHLAEGIAPTQAIDPRSLGGYLRGQELRCPLGEQGYAVFSFQHGPRCPNSDAHTLALKKTKVDLKVAREKLLVLLAECPNAARLLAKLDVLQNVTHRKLAKPRKAISPVSRRRREEKAVETLLRSVRGRTQRRLSDMDQETRGRLLHGLLTLAEEIRSSTGAKATA